VTTEHLFLLASMVCLIVAPTVIVHLLHRRRQKRRVAMRQRLEQSFSCGERRQRGRFCGDGRRTS